MAIAQSDQMYSKARALAYPFGNALALNAMGEVYSYTGRLREAGAAYEESLRLLDGMDGEDVHIRMLLVELIDYNLRIRNVNGASRYLARLNLYPGQIVETEAVVKSGDDLMDYTFLFFSPRIRFICCRCNYCAPEPNKEKEYI